MSKIYKLFQITNNFKGKPSRQGTTVFQTFPNPRVINYKYKTDLKYRIFRVAG
jgi:hypothetical protein